MVSRQRQAAADKANALKSGGAPANDYYAQMNQQGRSSASALSTGGGTKNVAQQNKMTAAQNQRNAAIAAQPKPLSQADQIAEMRKTKPKHISNLDEAGNLKAQAKVAPQKSNLKKLEAKQKNVKAIKETKSFKKGLTAVDNLTKEANQKGDSAWAKTAGQKADAQMAQAQDMATEQGARGLATAQNNMAQQGGLNAASRERMGMSANRDALKNSQGLAAQNSQNKLGFTMQDQQQKQQLRTQMPGMQLNMNAADVSRQAGNNSLAMDKIGAWGGMAQNEAQAAQSADQFNAGSYQDANQSANNFNQAGYAEDMQALTAGQLADAQGKKDKKSGLLGGNIINGIL